MEKSRSLAGKVALVAGATRGAGRGIAAALGEAGATVYCSGRSTRARPRAASGGGPFSLDGRPETVEETAELVSSLGGRGIAAVTDHSRPEEVEALAARIQAEQGGLDLLVNDIWGGDALTEWGVPFWELSLEKGFTLLQRALFTHVITARIAAPLLFGRKNALIVEVTDGSGLDYRHTLFYDLAKTSVIRLAFALSEELRDKGVAALAITPGFLRSEAVLEHFGVTEQTWRDGAEKDPNFLQSETPWFVGRGIAALAADPELFQRTGKVYSSWSLGREYGINDRDGSRPDWGAWAMSQDFGREQRASHARFLQAFASAETLPRS